MAENRNLSTENIQFLKACAGTLSDIFKGYSALDKEYPNSWLGNERISIRAEISKVQRLRTSITNLLNLRIGTDKDINGVKDSIDQILTTLVKVKNIVNKDKQSNEGLAGFLKQRNIDLDKIAKDLRGLSSKKSTGLGMSGAKPIEYTLGETMAMGAAYITGMTPLGVALQSAFDIQHHLKDTAAAIKAQKKLEGTPTEGGPGPGVASSGTVSPTIEEAANKEETTTSAFKRRGKWYEAERGVKGQIKNMTEIDPLHAALIKFFNISAYRTKWTKELLEAVQGKGPDTGDGKKEEKGPSIIGDLLKSGIGSMLAPLITTAMPVILGTLAVAGAGMLGAAVGHLVYGWMDKTKIGGKTINKHLQDFTVKHFMGGDVSDHLKKASQDKNLDPRVRRSLQLQAENPKMSVKDAVSQADKEWRNRPLVDVSGKEIPGTEGMRYGGDKNPKRPTGEAATATPTIPAKPTTTTPAAAISQKVTETVTGGQVTMTKSGDVTAIPESKLTTKQKVARAAYIKEHPEATSEYWDKKHAEAGKGDNLQKTFAGMRPKNMDEFVTDAQKGISAVTGAASKTLAEVPVDTIQANLQRETKEAMKNIHTAVSEMSQTLKESSKAGSKKRPSGYDANNTRNPVLSSLGAGQLDLADS